MNITRNASELDWRTNTKGAWITLVKDMTPNAVPVFSGGYTVTSTGKKVTVTNTAAPVGTMTYDSELTSAVNTAPLYGAGTVSDSLEAIAGKKTVRMGSVDLGTLDWSTNGVRFYASLSGVVPYVESASAANWLCGKYMVVSINGAAQLAPNACLWQDDSSRVSVRDNTYNNAADFKTAMSGVYLYYELAEPTTSTETTQSLSLTTGDDTISGGSFSATYEGTDYSIPLIRNCKYLHRSPDGTESLVTGSTTSTSIDVKGGESKLINLTQWFGRSREPSVADFYKLYPTWKNYDIPYDQGSVLNYKGTGVETIGFNAYDHSTGTASLLGGNKYQICGTYTSVSYVDIFGESETITLDSAGCFTPVNDGALTVTGGNGTDTCVHLVWSGYKNYGEPEYKWEPFTRNVKELPVSTYFPEGMNSVPSADGTGIVSDELTAEQKIQRIGVIDLGTLTYNDYIYTAGSTSYPYGYVSFQLPGKAKGDINFSSPMFVTSTNANGVNFSGDKSILGTSSNNTCYIINSDFIGMTGTQIQAALSGVLCYYELAAPVVTQLDQPLNLTYPVNDFGTEHSLPQNTTTLVTTDLKALIKYNTDYMRMNSQLSGIFPTVKSLAKQEQDGYIMKKDDTAPNATVGNAYNLIDRNAEGADRQFSFDTSGGTQDITDGTAVAKKVMGTTLNLNQLVHDTNQNIVTGTGQVEVEDAVAGDVTSFVVEGRSLVRNQLVPDTTQPKDASGNGLIQVTDAVQGSANGLTMYGDAYVRNQQFDWGTTSINGLNPSQYGTVTVDRVNGSATITVVETSVSNGFSVGNSGLLMAGHVYAIKFSATTSETTDAIQLLSTSAVSGTPPQFSAQANVKTALSCVVTIVTASRLNIYINRNGASVDSTFTLEDLQLVDLTQLCNGDSTKIAAIQTWDDLVAQYPEYAQYVAYNAGEVVGVQPTVKANAYVRNQYAPAVSSWGYSSSGGLNDISTNTTSNNVFTSSGTNQEAVSARYWLFIADFSHKVPFVNGHVYFVGANMTKQGVGGNLRLNVMQTGSSPVVNLIDYASSFSPTKVTFSGDTGNYAINVFSSSAITLDVGWSLQMSMQIVDLTQLCHGHQSLIDQIQTWDDLVARYPIYAQYVAYDTGTDINTGTMTASAPLFGVGSARDSEEGIAGSRTQVIGSYTFTGEESWIAYNSAWTRSFTGKAMSKSVAMAGFVRVNVPVNTQDNTTGICGGTNNANIYFGNQGKTTAAEFAAYMAGKTVYYELATPVQSSVTPSAITLQNGDNVVMQTDGGRTAEFDLGYNGLDYTIAIDSTRKYAFNDNGTTSMITNASSQAVRIGEDMLVDVTRMFNGDATAINAITSWNDMAAVMPEYLSNVAYNEGEVVGRSGGVTTTSGSSATFSDLHGVGDVKETLDIVTGEKTVKIGSVDMGTLDWILSSSGSTPTFMAIFGNSSDIITGSANGVAYAVCSRYVYNRTTTDKQFRVQSGAQQMNKVSVCVVDSDYSLTSDFKSAMSGVILYYELAEPVTSSLTPQPITFVAGLNNIHEENMDITGTPVTMEYTGTDYSIATKSAGKYIKTIDGTAELVTGVSSVDVRGGRDNLIDLTRMFGSGLEPGTLDDFYSLFPTWRGYRLPYNKGSLLNFKGTGLKSVGFNLLNVEGRTLGEPQYTNSSNTTIRGVFDETKYYVGLNSQNYYYPAQVNSYSVTGTQITVNAKQSTYGVAFPIRAIPGMTYRFEETYIGSGNRFAFYTYDGTYISGVADRYAEAPEDAYWCLVIYAPITANTATTWTNPCVHLQWSGTRNGDYEPYWDYVRPIPTLTYFPDGMNGRGAVYDEINPRQAVRRFGKVDLSTLTWTHTDSGTYGYWVSPVISGIAKPSANSVEIGLISEFYAVTNTTALNGSESMAGFCSVAVVGTIYVNNGSTTEPPTGWLVYELATPVVTTFPEEISATARISDYGTEECLPVNGYDPVTAPFRGMVLYQGDYARTITKLPENYQSQNSMENLLTLLGSLHNGVFTATYDSANQVYTYQFTPNA